MPREREEGLARLGEPLLGLLGEAEALQRRRVLGVERHGARERLDRVGRLPEPQVRAPEAELRRQPRRLQADDALERGPRRRVLPGRLAQLAEEVEHVGALPGELARALRRRRGLGVPAQAAERVRVLDAQLHVLAVVAARLAELARGLGAVALRGGAPPGRAVQLAEGRLQLDQLRIDRERARERGDGRLGLPDLALREPEAPQQRRVVRSDRDGAHQRVDFLLRVVGALVARRDQGEQDGVRWLQGDGGLERSDRLVVLAEPHQHLAEPPGGAAAPGIEVEPGPLRVDGLGVAAGEDERLREPEMGLGVLRPGAQPLPEGEERLVDLAAGAAHAGELAVGVGRVGGEARRLLQVLGGRPVLARPGEQHAQLEVRVGEARIELQREQQLAPRLGRLLQRDERARVVEARQRERRSPRGIGEREGLLQRALRLPRQSKRRYASPSARSVSTSPGRR